MNSLLIILSGIGGAFVLYWLASFAIGSFSDKKKLGEHWIKQNLKSAGIDPRSVDPEIISKISQTAHLITIASGPNYGRFDATTFKQELDDKSRILIRHLFGADLNDDEKFMIGLIEDLPPPLTPTPS